MDLTKLEEALESFVREYLDYHGQYPGGTHEPAWEEVESEMERLGYPLRIV